jgi:hypothetical protein
MNEVNGRGQLQASAASGVSVKEPIRWRGRVKCCVASAKTKRQVKDLHHGAIMSYMERKKGTKPKRIAPPLVSQLLDYQQQYGDEEESQYAEGYRRGISDAVGLAEMEEPRVRGVIESHDGTCLDDEEDRKRFIHDLYGGEEGLSDQS